MLFSKEEKEMIIIALNMRANFVQTGSVSLSPEDVANMGADAAKCEYGAAIKPLTVDQMRLIITTYDIIKKLLSP